MFDKYYKYDILKVLTFFMTVFAKDISASFCSK